MFKFVLLSCLLVAALAHPHHTPEQHHVVEDKVEAAKPQDADAKPTEDKPHVTEAEAVKPAEEHKESEPEAKPDADAAKKESHDHHEHHEAPASSVDTHHVEPKPVRS